MGSVIEQIECPECKSEEAANDYYYKSGEEYITCGRCGYYYSHTLNEDKTSFITEEHKNDIAYCVEYDYTPMMHCGGILKEDLEQFKKDAKETQKEHNVKQIILSLQNEKGEWIKENIF